MPTTLADPAIGGPADHHPQHAKTGFWTLTLGSLGVVYGDIGTSPLYALKESLTAASAGGPLMRDAVFGVVSLVLWALIVIVTLNTSSSSCGPTTTARAGRSPSWRSSSA
jgi:KUP system potassium uptake protein